MPKKGLIPLSLDSNEEARQERAERARELIGTTLGQYRIIGLKKATANSGVYEAEDMGLHRKVALKVLNEDPRPEKRELFDREGPILATLDSHPNVAKVFTTNEDKGRRYIAMEWVPEDDLKEAARKGTRYSYRESIEGLLQITEAVSFVHGKGYTHDDLKPGNIIMRGNRVFVLDFGSKLTRDAARNDLVGIGEVGQHLLSYSSGKTPRKFREVVENAANGVYTSPEELAHDLRKCKRHVQLRKTLPKIAGVAAVLLIGAASYVGYQSHLKQKEYERSAAYSIDKIKQLDVEDPVFETQIKELKHRLFEKVKKVAKTIAPQSSPFAVAAPNNKWYVHNENDYSTGFWRNILWEGVRCTGDKELEVVARASTEEMKDSAPKDRIGAQTRYLYSHIKAFEVTQEKKYLAKAIEEVKGLEALFNDEYGFIVMDEDLKPVCATNITTGDMVPGLLKMYQHTGNWHYKEIAKKHMESIIRLNIRSNGSVIEQVLIDQETREPIRAENANGIDNTTTVSRAQANVLRGLVKTYTYTQDPAFLDSAEKVADYFITHLPQDYIPYYDLHAPEGSYKDSSAAAIAAGSLRELGKITNNPSYEKTYRNILKSLATKYVSSDPSYDGIVRHACLSVPKDRWKDTSLILGDNAFLVEAISCPGYKDRDAPEATQNRNRSE